MNYKLPPLPEREAFEAWMQGDATISLEKDGHGYVDMTAELMWHAWKARATLEAQGAPDHCDPSCTSYDLAAMVMSDCGHSTNNQRLLDRIAARIDRHVEELLASAPPAPQVEHDRLAYTEAVNLATALFKKHFAQEEHYASGRVVWGLCDTTAGVISQIDNMVSGLVQPTTAPQAKPQPLSDEQIAEIFSVRRGAVTESHLLGCARAIEAAHGITKE